MGIWTGADQEAKELIYKLYKGEYEKLVRCAISYLKTGNDEPNVRSRAEDVVQETFTLFWERRRDVLSKEKPVGWLYKALQRKAWALLKEENKWIRRLNKYKQFYTQPDESYISLEMERLEMEDLVSKEDFTLLYKFCVAGYTYQELSEETGLSKSALGTRIHRAKRKIREKLEK